MNYTRLTDYDTSTREYTFENLIVKGSTQRAIRMFIEEHHYSGGMGNAAIPVGCYDQQSGDMVGAIAFHCPISENVRASIFGEEHKDKVIELHRMAIIDAAPHNTGSWFISRALDWVKQTHPEYLACVSFADTTEGHTGTVYQAANADYYGKTAESTFYIDGEGVLRSPRQDGENISQSQAKERGWEPTERQAKHRYVFWLPDAYQSKDELREMAKIELQEYPE